MEVAHLDLASFASIESFAARVKASALLRDGGGRLDCLLNNAGAMVSPPHLSHTCPTRGQGQGWSAACSPTSLGRTISRSAWRALFVAALLAAAVEMVVTKGKCEDSSEDSSDRTFYPDLYSHKRVCC